MAEAISADTDQRVADLESKINSIGNSQAAIEFGLDGCRTNSIAANSILVCFGVARPNAV